MNGQRWHIHKCDCGFRWAHETPNHPVSEKNRDAIHRCPSCGLTGIFVIEEPFYPVYKSCTRQYATVLMFNNKDKEEYTDSVSDICEKVISEVFRANNKFGEKNNHSNFDYWFAVLSEEVGEVAKALVERDSLNHLEDELTQVAGVAINMIHAIRKHRSNKQ